MKFLNTTLLVLSVSLTLATSSTLAKNRASSSAKESNTAYRLGKSRYNVTNSRWHGTWRSFRSFGPRNPPG